MTIKMLPEQTGFTDEVTEYAEGILYMRESALKVCMTDTDLAGNFPRRSSA